MLSKKMRASFNSNLLQDPLFEDPSSRRYALGAASPALGLGIKQVDLDNIGVKAAGKYH